MKKNLKQHYYNFIALITMAFLTLPLPAFAIRGEGEKIVTGLKALATDLTTAIVGLAAVIMILMAVFCLVMMSISTPEEQIKWKSRLKGALIFGIGAILGSVLVNTLLAYFQ